MLLVNLDLFDARDFLPGLGLSIGVLECSCPLELVDPPKFITSTLPEQETKIPQCCAINAFGVDGSFEDVKAYKLSKKIKVTWLEDGDHSFKPRKKSGQTLEGHLENVADGISLFVNP